MFFARAKRGRMVDIHCHIVPGVDDGARTINDSVGMLRCAQEEGIVAMIATPNEGKSTVSFELALAFADAGKKTLLIDADMRKSVMRSRYKRGRVHYGLTNYLAGMQSVDEVTCSTDVKNFNMIFAGPVPPNPSELLGNARFAALVEEARANYDIVIIDTPPVGSVIDAVVVSKNCDGVAVVMGAAEISHKFARRIKNQLEVANAKVLGVILNKVNLSGRSNIEFDEWMELDMKYINESSLSTDLIMIIKTIGAVLKTQGAE